MKLSAKDLKEIFETAKENINEECFSVDIGEEMVEDRTRWHFFIEKIEDGWWWIEANEYDGYGHEPIDTGNYVAVGAFEHLLIECAELAEECFVEEEVDYGIKY